MKRRKRRRTQTAHHYLPRIQSEVCLKKSQSADKHNPFQPHRGRGIYGFALYLFSWFLLGLYLVWAFAPHYLLASTILNDVLPSKYWAIVLPQMLTTSIVVYMIFCAGIFMIRFDGLFEREQRLKDDFED